MPHPSQASITRLLEAAVEGDHRAMDTLYPLVYDELVALAHRHRQRWHGNHTLDSVALVGELYEKLFKRTSLTLKSRAHFFALASRAMRQILMDYAKEQKAEKRWGHLQRESLGDVKGFLGNSFMLSEEKADVLVALDEAMKRLAQFAKRQSQVVECRFFGGMTIKETAEALDMGVATVNRDWEVAKTWLHREIKNNLGR